MIQTWTRRSSERRTSSVARFYSTSLLRLPTAMPAAGRVACERIEIARAGCRTAHARRWRGPARCTTRIDDRSRDRDRRARRMNNELLVDGWMRIAARNWDHETVAA